MTNYYRRSLIRELRARHAKFDETAPTADLAVMRDTAPFDNRFDWIRDGEIVHLTRSTDHQTEI